jgi:hypothetical protein
LSHAEHAKHAGRAERAKHAVLAHNACEPSWVLDFYASDKTNITSGAGGGGRGAEAGRWGSSVTTPGPEYTKCE